MQARRLKALVGLLLNASLFTDATNEVLSGKSTFGGSCLLGDDVKYLLGPICGRSPAEIVGSNLTGGMDVCLLLVFSVVR